MSKPAANLQRVVPARYAARALWRGCRWAVNMAAWHGRFQNGPNYVFDNTHNLGRFTGGVSGSMNAIRNGGRFGNSFAGNSQLEWIDNQWQAIPQLGIYYWLDSGGFSLACTMRFVAIPAADGRILTKRFGTTNNFHCGALSFNVAAGNKFEFSYCNGVGAVQSIFGTTTPVTGVTYNIVGRHWGSTLLKAELWVNGKMEAQNNATATYPAYKKDPPIHFFGDTGSGNPTINAEASMGGLWNRPLTSAEIGALNVNPYVMWGNPAAPQGLPFGAAGGGVGCNCCPGWLCNWNDM